MIKPEPETTRPYTSETSAPGIGQFLGAQGPVDLPDSTLGVRILKDRPTKQVRV